MKAIEQLKAGGYKVSVRHIRLIKKNGELSARGGKTVVVLTKPDGKVLVGEARCHSNDNYSKREGIIEALKKINQRVKDNA